MSLKLSYLSLNLTLRLYSIRISLRVQRCKIGEDELILYLSFDKELSDFSLIFNHNYLLKIITKNNYDFDAHKKWVKNAYRRGVKCI